MAKTKRYIISSRSGPKLDPKAAQVLEAFVSDKNEASIVKRTPVGRHIVEMTEEQRRELASNNPDLVIEEDQELEMFPMPGLPEIASTGGALSLPVVVKDATNDTPIPNVTIFGIGQGPAYKAVTDDKGQAVLQTGESLLTQLIVSPRDTYWSRVLKEVSVTGMSPLEIKLKPLMLTGAYTWGHKLMGFPRVNRYWTGAGVKVGVIDSGMSNTLPDLKPSGGHNTLDGQDPNTWFVDEKGHGTHCGGIIAGLNNTIGILGGAPNAEVYSVKVFPGGYVSDLVHAIEWCIQNGMDVISMSLGSSEPSRVMAAALRDAYDRGITCVAAAGNDSTHVAFPAAFPTSLAVSAIGRFNTFPEDSGHALKVGRDVDRQGQLFAANFTNFGPEIEVCAPGVAILSTVPTGYVAWDGTSFSCPLVSALVALILEAYPSIRTGDAQQPEYVRWILGDASLNIGLPPQIQGKGLPTAPRALASAQYYSPQASWATAQSYYAGY